MLQSLNRQCLILRGLTLKGKSLLWLTVFLVSISIGELSWAQNEIDPTNLIEGGSNTEVTEDDLVLADKHRVHPALLKAIEKFGLGELNSDEFGSFLILLYIIGASLIVGALLAYHPCHLGKTMSLEAMDQPKIIITYTFIGALCGVLFASDPRMGMVIFGIGGLMRFRTDVGAARDTGRVIAATILGIFCGLEFWIPVILGVIVAWLLILVLDWKIGVRMVVRGLAEKSVKDSAVYYRSILETFPLTITQEKKNPKKGTITFVFKASRSLDRDALEVALDEQVPTNTAGTVDWPKEG